MKFDAMYAASFFPCVGSCDLARSPLPVQQVTSRTTVSTEKLDIMRILKVRFIRAVCNHEVSQLHL